MPSPFPGMNPYFERSRTWRGFHSTFLIHLREALVALLVPRYVVNVEESLFIDETEGQERLFAVGDSSISEVDRQDSLSDSATVTIAPVTGTILLPKGLRRKRRWLTIRDPDGRTVVAVIELLSPSDKRAGKDRERYLRKRERILRSSAHLIELDFLRGGERMPTMGLPTCDYLVAISRRWERPRVGLWPFNFRDPFPPLYIPLHRDEPEAVIDLKSVLDRTYDGAGYVYQIYRDPPQPALTPVEAEWAAGLVPKP